MSTNDADHEYGPTPAGAQYEHTDIEPTIATKFAVWLTVATMLSAGIVYGTFWLFEGQESEASRAAQTFPLAAGQVRAVVEHALTRVPFYRKGRGFRPNHSRTPTHCGRASAKG